MTLEDLSPPYDSVRPGTHCGGPTRALPAILYPHRKSWPGLILSPPTLDFLCRTTQNVAGENSEFKSHCFLIRGLSSDGAKQEEVETGVGLIQVGPLIMENMAALYYSIIVRHIQSDIVLHPNRSSPKNDK